MTERKRVADADAEKKPRKPRKAAQNSAKRSVRTQTAAETRAKGTGRGGGGEPATNIQRGIRDMILLNLAAEGKTNAQISAVDGRSVQQIKRTRDAYEKHGVGGRGLLEHDPVRIVEEMLDRTVMTWRLAATLAEAASNSNVAIGALKLMLQADARQQDLLQSIGKLPKELGTLRHVIDIRQIAVNLLDVVEKLEAGEVGPEAVRATLGEMMGLTGGIQALPPGSGSDSDS